MSQVIVPSEMTFTLLLNLEILLSRNFELFNDSLFCMRPYQNQKDLLLKSPI